jgi:hypothetical protein
VPQRPAVRTAAQPCRVRRASGERVEAGERQPGEPSRSTGSQEHTQGATAGSATWRTNRCAGSWDGPRGEDAADLQAVITSPDTQVDDCGTGDEERVTGHGHRREDDIATLSDHHRKHLLATSTIHGRSSCCPRLMRSAAASRCSSPWHPGCRSRWHPGGTSSKPPPTHQSPDRNCTRTSAEWMADLLPTAAPAVLLGPCRSPHASVLACEAGSRCRHASSATTSIISTDGCTALG